MTIKFHLSSGICVLIYIDHGRTLLHKRACFLDRIPSFSFAFTFHTFSHLVAIPQWNKWKIKNNTWTDGNHTKEGKKEKKTRVHVFEMLCNFASNKIFKSIMYVNKERTLLGLKRFPLEIYGHWSKIESERVSMLQRNRQIYLYIRSIYMPEKSTAIPKIRIQFTQNIYATKSKLWWNVFCMVQLLESLEGKSFLLAFPHRPPAFIRLHRDLYMCIWRIS